MIEIAALYHFARWPNFADKRAALQALCDSHGAKGSLLIAHEGINGTIATERGHMDNVLAGIRAITGFTDLSYKTAFHDQWPFLRMKVRLKEEIVTIGDKTVDPLDKVGVYVDPKDWNALLADPDIVLLDARNDYEVRIGTFRGALDPKTQSFSEFPRFVKNNLDPKRHRKIAMFCTGGIRCEKASAFMLNEGYEEVYHLKGGILNYLEKIPEQDSLWDGGCFVFDSRVAVGHALKAGDFTLCHGCRQPLTAEERAHPDFEEGVSCPHCAHHMSEAQKASARERQRQVKLAEQRGKTHLGAIMPKAGAAA